MINKLKYSDNTLVVITFFLFGLFPILPFNLKPMTIIFPLIIGIWVLVKNRKIYFKRIFFFNSIIFIIYLVSVLYSDDKEYALKRTQTIASIILIPLFYSLISSMSIGSKTLIILENFFFYTFYISSILLSIVIYIYIFNLGYFNESVSYGYSLSYIEHHLWVFNDHPIYLSIFIGLSLIVSLSIINSKTNKKINIFVIMGNLILLSVLVFLSRKGVIFAFIISFIYLLFKTFKSLKIASIIGFITLSIVSLFYFISSDSSQRIIEILNKDTYTKILVEEPKSSTSIRLGIYNCAMKNIYDAGLIGFGVGDTKDVLKNCYEKTSQILVKGNYNTHNQFFNFWLSFGVLGLLLLLFVLFKLFQLGNANKDFMFISVLIFYCLIMMTENILDRQNGVMLFSIVINFFTFKNIRYKINNEKNSDNRSIS